MLQSILDVASRSKSTLANFNRFTVLLGSLLLNFLFKNFQGCIAVYLSRYYPEVSIRFGRSSETEKEGFEPSRRY